MDYIGFINLLWCKSEWDTEFFHIRDQEVEQVLTSGESATCGSILSVRYRPLNITIMQLYCIVVKFD